MEELIRQAFLNIESHYSRVNQGCYDLLGPNSEFILPGEWETIIEPGMAVSMHMWAENLHEHLIRGYMLPLKTGDIPPFQPRRTLDQYFYTHLENTSRRDKDQVVYRYTERSSAPKIFMVDQLWLWVLANGTNYLLRILFIIPAKVF
jgi:hypothetical protein